MKARFAARIIALLASLTAAPASAFTIATDLIVSGTYETISGSASHGASLRTHSLLLLGEEGFRYGLGFQFEMPSGDTKEYIAAAAVQFGDRLFFGLGAGYLSRDFSGYLETGLGGWAQPGYAFELSSSVDLRVSVPVVVKYVTSGIAPKLVIDYVPYFGLGFNL